MPTFDIFYERNLEARCFKSSFFTAQIKKQYEEKLLIEAEQKKKKKIVEKYSKICGS